MFAKTDTFPRREGPNIIIQQNGLPPLVQLNSVSKHVGGEEGRYLGLLISDY